MHTTESDGSHTISEMADVAMAMGYEYIAITDHSKAVGIAHGLDEKRLLKHLDAIDGVNVELKKENKEFRILKGAEVDILTDGTLDYDSEILKKLDCVVGAVHSSFAMEFSVMTERIVKALSSGMLNILAHPTGRLIGMRKPYACDMEKIMDSAKEFGVAMELNSYPERLDINDTHCRLAKEKAVMVSISTDSHSKLSLSNISYGIHTARRGWLEKENILNALSLNELMKVLRK